MKPKKLKNAWPNLPAAGVLFTAKKIKKKLKLKDFKEAMAFVNKVAEIAESEGHHPDIHIFYNQVRIELWTHAVGGLSENDFIMAAKLDGLD